MIKRSLGSPSGTFLYISLPIPHFGFSSAVDLLYYGHRQLSRIHRQLDPFYHQIPTIPFRSVHSRLFGQKHTNFSILSPLRSLQNSRRSSKTMQQYSFPFLPDFLRKNVNSSLSCPNRPLSPSGELLEATLLALSSKWLPIVPQAVLPCLLRLFMLLSTRPTRAFSLSACGRPKYVCCLYLANSIECTWSIASLRLWQIRLRLVPDQCNGYFLDGICSLHLHRYISPLSPSTPLQVCPIWCLLQDHWTLALGPCSPWSPLSSWTDTFSPRHLANWRSQSLRVCFPQLSPIRRCLPAEARLPYQRSLCQCSPARRYGRHNRCCDCSHCCGDVLFDRKRDLR